MNPTPKSAPQPPISEAHKRWLEIKAANPGLSDHRTTNLLHSEGILYSVTNLLDYEAALQPPAPLTPPPAVLPPAELVSANVQPPPGQLGEVGELPATGDADYSLKQIGEALGITTTEARSLMNTSPLPDGFPAATLVRKQGFGETWRVNLDALMTWHAAHK